MINRIAERLCQPLPGISAQAIMSPLSYHDERFNPGIPPDAKRGAVMILLHEDSFPIIRRASYSGPHSGQMALPGGKLEPGEQDMDAALRETEEEIGVSRHNIEVLGKLSSLYIPPSRFLVTPFIGVVSDKMDFRPEPREVDAVFEITLTDLVHDKTIRSKKMNLPNRMVVDTPYFYLAGQVVWGATAMILSEFKEIIKEVPGIA